MQKGRLIVAFLVVALAVGAWFYTDGPGFQPRVGPAAGPGHARTPEVADAAAGETEEVGENPRTRPSKPPVERTYAKPQVEYPVAEKVPGKAGFVFSPHNGKIVDVTGIPAGTLVADPTYPPEEKMYFRVPE